MTDNPTAAQTQEANKEIPNFGPVKVDTNGWGHIFIDQDCEDKFFGARVIMTPQQFEEVCQEWERIRHPSSVAAPQPAPQPTLTPNPSCTVCHHPMRFHDDPGDGSHWCLACVSRANEKRAAECLEVLKKKLVSARKLLAFGTWYQSGCYEAEETMNLLDDVIARAEAAIAAKDAGKGNL